MCFATRVHGLDLMWRSFPSLLCLRSLCSLGTLPNRDVLVFAQVEVLVHLITENRNSYTVLGYKYFYRVLKLKSVAQVLN
jgi:hypothetical protein